ncbi:steryl deacetylase KNAG_0K00330 [Huiozyma naganishii CBS 8797]|uniref:Alpha/beta hydrolase fold-3 domain-containing protein n=1 Tax=Huiozyma naganishii (strain ATCC MYA-139 / BCRC 22969 / CBS 8797 / KCTC 17520 / NBRC 10181 / NCYC 3082 / Yp74L-3) TaxID=1071383 RepID=J7SAR1_HUIN7|nr:hypothetical protein KNAG_0K00330 [Kazachstania naganishii CBS 8797]CCK72401.1 hypothetical protein KNAG_0K00330 [Kazachstania naganishii CBS 8797]
MCTSSALFILRIIVLLPIRLIQGGIKTFRLGALSGNILVRVFMREALLLCDKTTFKDVLNPLFDMCLSICLGKKSFEVVSYPFKDLQTEALASQTANISTKFYWYCKPDNFDPETDPLIIFSHGGGFAIKAVPTSLFFFRNLSRLYPRTSIVMHDYTVTDMDHDSVRHPRQLLETVALYLHFSTILHYKNITMIGESAGGHLVLSLLHYLETRHLHLPRKVVAVSPWCNPNVCDPEERRKAPCNGSLDSLSFKGLDKFTALLKPSDPIYNADPLLNLETNFTPDTWNAVLKQTQIMVTYGRQEVLKFQIEKFVSKLAQLPSAPANLTVYEDGNGGHIEPFLNFQRNETVWSMQPNIASILKFLEQGP